MKGWVKGMLIASVACIGAGTLLCAGAWGMGGRFYYFRNRNFGITEEKMVQIAEDEIVMEDAYREADARKADGVAGEGQIKEGDVIPKQPSGAGAEAKSGGTIVRKLEIEVAGGWVEVVPDDSTDQIVVASSHEDYRCRQELDGDKLEIYVGLDLDFDHWLDSGAWHGWDGSGDGEPAATIRIPAGVCFDQADLEVKAGVVSVRQLSAKKMDLEVKAGSLEVAEGSVQELDGECKTGELIYEGQVGREMKAECSTGSVQYVIDGSQEDFWYEVDAAITGSVRIDGEENGLLERDHVIHNPGAAKKASLECKTGVIDISFQ